MRKVKIEGKSYDLHPDDMPRYDGYYYRGEITKHSPVDSRIIGYIQEDKQKIAICRKDQKGLRKVLYGVVAASGVVVLVGAVAVIGFDVTVPHWEVNRNGDDIIGELDDGTVRASKKFTYSQYVTYDGERVALYVDAKGQGEVSLSINGVETPYVSAKEAYSIPMTLGLEEQDVVEGVLRFKQGETVTEYPIVVEHLSGTKPLLAVGSYDDNEAAKELVGKSQLSSMLQDPTKDPDEDKDEEVDFKDFEVIRPKEIPGEDLE